MGQPAARLGRCQPGERRQAGEAEEGQPFVARGVEVRAGSRQDQPAHVVRMAPPQQLGDGAAHRVAEGDDGSRVQGFDHRRHVVGAVLEAECSPAADAQPVTAVVEGEHPEVLAERCVGGEEVEVGGRRPTVQQHDDGCAGRSGDLAQVHRSRPGSSSSRPGGSGGATTSGVAVVDRGGIAGEIAQAVSTSRTRTCSWAPVGAS